MRGRCQGSRRYVETKRYGRSCAPRQVAGKAAGEGVQSARGPGFLFGSGWWRWRDGKAAVRPSPVHLPVRGCPWQEPRIIGEIQAVWAVGRVPEVRVLKSTSSGGLKRLDLSLLVPIKSTIDRAATAPHLESLWGGGKIAELRPY